MKSLILAVLLVGCATTNPHAYQEMDSCPASMTEEQHLSGVVRCRALCSSYARDFAEFSQDCKCWCQPAQQKAPAPTYQNPMHMSSL